MNPTTLATAGLRKPAPGDGVVLLGLSDQPWAARVEQKDDDTLLIVGQGLATQAGRSVEVVFLADGTRASVAGDLEGPPGRAGDLVLLQLTSTPRPTRPDTPTRVALRTTVVVAAPVWETPALAVSEDVSATGVRVRLSRRLEEGDESRLTLTLPSGAVVEVDARVARCDDTGGGSGHIADFTFPRHEKIARSLSETVRRRLDGAI